MLEEEENFIYEKTAKIYSRKETFYNKAQILNRDITLCALNVLFKDYEEPKLLFAMEASGIRGIRYLKEVGYGKIFLNDLSADAIKLMKSNLILNDIKDFKDLENINGLRKEEGKVNIVQGDCNNVLCLNKGVFDYIDIDPFGSCNTFVNQALMGIKHKGIISFTSTDKASLLINVDKCYMKYDVLIKRSFSSDEMPVRVLLSYISRSAAKFGYKIEPLVSLNVDYYLRVIVRIIKNKGKSVIDDNSYFKICDCGNRFDCKMKLKEIDICDYCSKKIRAFGPFWNKNIKDSNLLGEMIKGVEEFNNQRLFGILNAMEQELDVLFTYQKEESIPYINSENVKLKSILNCLANAEYDVSLVHGKASSFKTNAPFKILCEVISAINKKDDSKYSFIKNKKVEDIYSVNYYRGLIESKMGPGKVLSDKL